MALGTGRWLMEAHRSAASNAWVTSRQLAGHVYKLTEAQGFSELPQLRRGMRGAAISAMNDIARALHSASAKEFDLRLESARRAYTQVLRCLSMAMNEGLLGRRTFEEIYAQAERTRQMADDFPKGRYSARLIPR